ncbi:hypothetical protein V8E54_004231 [Elaphomyces granulatus]
MSVADLATEAGPGSIQLDLVTWALPVCVLLVGLVAILLVLTLQYARYRWPAVSDAEAIRALDDLERARGRGREPEGLCRRWWNSLFGGPRQPDKEQ